jgi:BTB/POZ domain
MYSPEISNKILEINDLASLSQKKFVHVLEFWLGRKVTVSRHQETEENTEAPPKKRLKTDNLSIKNFENILGILESIDSISLSQISNSKNNASLRSILKTIKYKLELARTSQSENIEDQTKILDLQKKVRTVSTLFKDKKEKKFPLLLCKNHQLALYSDCCETIDDAKLEQMLEGLSEEFRNDINYFDFSNYKNFSSNVPGILLKYLPNLHLSQFQSMPSAWLDVDLFVDGKKISGNKSLFSATSSFFNRMFNGNMREKDQKEIVIKQLSFEGFNDCFSIFLTPKGINRDEWTVQSLTEALTTAEYLGMPQALIRIINILCAKINHYQTSKELLSEILWLFSAMHPTLDEYKCLDKKWNDLISSKQQHPFEQLQKSLVQYFCKFLQGIQGSRYMQIERLYSMHFPLKQILENLWNHNKNLTKSRDISASLCIESLRIELISNTLKPDSPAYKLMKDFLELSKPSKSINAEMPFNIQKDPYIKAVCFLLQNDDPVLAELKNKISADVDEFLNDYEKKPYPTRLFCYILLNFAQKYCDKRIIDIFLAIPDNEIVNHLLKVGSSLLQKHDFCATACAYRMLFLATRLNPTNEKARNLFQIAEHTYRAQHATRPQHATS